MSPFSLIPFEARLLGLALVALGLWWGLEEWKSSIEDAALSKQNEQVALEAAKDSAASVRRLEAEKLRTAAVLRERDRRLAASEKDRKEKDDEMERLKRERPDVAEWAKQPVPDPVRDRHNRVR